MKVVPKLRQEVKVKINIVTSDDIKIYYTGKFPDFNARYIIKIYNQQSSIEINWIREWIIGFFFFFEMSIPTIAF